MKTKTKKAPGSKSKAGPQISQIAQKPDEKGQRAALPTMTSVDEQRLSMICLGANLRRDGHSGKAFDDLTASIAANGIIEPIICCRQDGKTGVLLICGYRRYHAAKKAGLETVPARIFDDELDKAQIMDLQLDENLRREDVNPADEAEAITGYMAKAKVDVHEMALRIGKSESFVHSRMRLKKLHPTLFKQLAEGALDTRKALFLAGIEDQNGLLEHLHRYGNRPGDLGFAQLCDTVEENFLMRLSAAKFDRDECEQCISRSDRQADLFGGQFTGKDARCTNRKCWAEKTLAAVQAKVEKLAEAGAHLITEAEMKADREAAYNRKKWQDFDHGNYPGAHNIRKECTDGCANLGVHIGGRYGGDGELHLYCGDKKCLTGAKAEGKEKTGAAADTSGRKEDRRRQLQARVEEWAWPWAHNWLVAHIESGKSEIPTKTAPCASRAAGAFTALLLAAAADKYGDYGYFETARKHDFAEMHAGHVITKFVADIGRLRHLGIDPLIFALDVGMDLQAEFRPTEEFLKLYQTSQLHDLVKQTGYDKLLEAADCGTWEKLSKTGLIKVIVALGAKTSATSGCKLPAEIAAAFGLKKS